MLRALEPLIDRHGGGNYADFTLKLTFPRHPDGLYLIKGGGPDVWRKFAVPRCWRKAQGIIRGKRCVNAYSGHVSKLHAIVALQDELTKERREQEEYASNKRRELGLP